MHGEAMEPVKGEPPEGLLVHVVPAKPPEAHQSGLKLPEGGGQGRRGEGNLPGLLKEGRMLSRQSSEGGAQLQDGSRLDGEGDEGDGRGAHPPADTAGQAAPGVRRGGSRETRGCPKKPFKTELLRCMLENLVGETKAEGRNMTFGG